MTKPSHTIDPKLETILKDNPFRDSKLIASWEKELSKLREGELGPCDLDYDFVLEDDAAFLHSKPKHIRKPFCERVYTKVLPQPMTGHPQAPIWILLLNPGFCAKDYYDHINVSEKMCAGIIKKDPKHYAKDSFDLPESIPERKLEKRQKLILSDLRADKWPAPFYILDESFETSTKDTADGWHWWRKRLGLGNMTNSLFPASICDDGQVANAVGRCLFVLEAFPYHSSSFPFGMVEKWIEKETASFRFWKQLVQYGLAHKEVIIRAQRGQQGSLVRLLNHVGLNKFGENVHFVKSVRNVSFTRGNIENPKPILNAIQKSLASMS